MLSARGTNPRMCVRIRGCHFRCGLQECAHAPRCAAPRCAPRCARRRAPPAGARVRASLARRAGGARRRAARRGRSARSRRLQVRAPRPAGRPTPPRCATRRAAAPDPALRSVAQGSDARGGRATRCGAARGAQERENYSPRANSRTPRGCGSGALAERWGTSWGCAFDLLRVASRPCRRPWAVALGDVPGRPEAAGKPHPLSRRRALVRRRSLDAQRL